MASFIPALQGAGAGVALSLAEFGGLLTSEAVYTGKVDPTNAAILGAMSIIPAVGVLGRANKALSLDPIPQGFYNTLEQDVSKNLIHKFNYTKEASALISIKRKNIQALIDELNALQKKSEEEAYKLVVSAEREAKARVTIFGDMREINYPLHEPSLIEISGNFGGFTSRKTIEMYQVIEEAQIKLEELAVEYQIIQEQLKELDAILLSKSTIATETMGSSERDIYLNKQLQTLYYRLKELDELASGAIKIMTVNDLRHLAGKLGWSINGRQAWAVLLRIKSEVPQWLGWKIYARLTLKELRNPDNLRRIGMRANRMLSMANPSTAIGRIADKIFDPIRERIQRVIKAKSEKLYKAIRKFNRGAVSRLRGNHILPTERSSAILGLRIVPDPRNPVLSRVWVEWLKQGYESTPITPSLSALDIEKFFTLSAGHEYHKYRRLYGFDKSLIGSNNARLIALGEQLGFIPDQWISLSVSVVGNIRNFTSQTKKWSDFGRLIKEETYEKVGEAFAGEWGKEISRRNFEHQWDGLDSWFGGKMREITERSESNERKASKQAQGKLNAVRSIGSIK